ncbi:hypothetical protein [Maribellus sediminis]|uniref:hypothetical protein n=1 Tax=Maribellus sediminis TaxID=2696285 RepID=UPI00143130AE|nr:hypothetical protein [Maribellus sediminis]
MMMFTNYSPFRRHIFYSSQLKAIRLLLIILLFTATTASGQTDFRPGYYITWENDTVHGLVDYRGNVRNSSFCAFKTNKDAEPIKFEPSDIKAYRFTNSKYYISKSIETEDGTKQVFLEFILDGITKLYFYATSYTYMYFLEDKNMQMLRLQEEEIEKEVPGIGKTIQNTNRYIGLLKTSMADCMEIQPEIDKARLSHKSLLKITKDYHDYVCTDQECIVFEKPLPPLRAKLSPLVGFGVWKLNVSSGDYPVMEYPSTSALEGGILLNLYSPALNEKISLDFGLAFTKVNYHGSNEYNTGIWRTYSESFLSQTIFEPSFGFRYTYPKGKFRPTIAAGTLFDVNISIDSRLIIETEKSDKVETQELSESPFSPSSLGWFLRLGCDFNLSRNKIPFFVFATYTQTKAQNSNNKTSFRKVGINMGIYLTGNKK